MKYAFIRAHREEFGVRAMCRVLRVHFSGFYAWLKEPLSHRGQEDARQTELIRQAWAESGKVYGYRKLTDDLRDQGERISENRVARLASLAGSVAQIGYRRRPGRYGGKPAVVAENRLEQRFEASRPDQVWVAAITYIKTHEGWRPPWAADQWRPHGEPLRRHRSVLAPRRWLVRPVPHDNGSRSASPADGRLATKARQPGHGAFRPGLPVHQPGVANLPPPARP